MVRSNICSTGRGGSPVQALRRAGGGGAGRGDAHGLLLAGPAVRGRRRHRAVADRGPVVGGGPGPGVLAGGGPRRGPLRPRPRAPAAGGGPPRGGGGGKRGGAGGGA